MLNRNALNACVAAYSPRDLVEREEHLTLARELA